MNDMITIRGYVATEVRSTTTDSGLPVAGFRICTTERRYDRMLGTWRDGQTNWYSINLFRQLAVNVGVSVQKGDRVVITGRLRVRPWSREDGRTGTAVEIDAESVGHDLCWGTARYRRNPGERAGDAAGSGLAGTAGTGTGQSVNGLGPEADQIRTAQLRDDPESMPGAAGTTEYEQGDQDAPDDPDGSGPLGAETADDWTSDPVLEDAGKAPF